MCGFGPKSMRVFRSQGRLAKPGGARRASGRSGDFVFFEVPTCSRCSSLAKFPKLQTSRNFGSRRPWSVLASLVVARHGPCRLDQCSPKISAMKATIRNVLSLGRQFSGHFAKRPMLQHRGFACALPQERAPRTWNTSSLVSSAHRRFLAPWLS